MHTLPVLCPSTGSFHRPKLSEFACESRDFVVAMVSDSQSSARLFRQHMEHISWKKPDLFVHVGDMVQTGAWTKEWRTYWTAPMEVGSLGQSTPVLSVLGNHDGQGARPMSYTSIPAAWYATTQAGARFVVLNTNMEGGRTDMTKQTEWLKAELQSEATVEASFRIVVLHIPPYAEFWSDMDDWQTQRPFSDFVRENWAPLFEASGVDLVVSGHCHIYQRGTRNGVMYAIIGGGGGTLDRSRINDFGFYQRTIDDFHHVMVTLPVQSAKTDSECVPPKPQAMGLPPGKEQSAGVDEPELQKKRVQSALGAKISPRASSASGEKVPVVRTASVLRWEVFDINNRMVSRWC